MTMPTRQRGAITVIGALLVLTIMMIVMAAALAYMRPAETKSEATAFAQMILATREAVAQAYRHNASAAVGDIGYNGLSNATALSDGLIPEPWASRQRSGLQANPWGGTWYVSASVLWKFRGYPTHMQFVVVGMPTPVCMALVDALRGDAYALTVGTVAIANALVYPPDWGAPLSANAFDTKSRSLCSAGTNAARTLYAIY